MPIPTPKSGETEQEFIGRCVSAIYDEYGEEQSLGICYSTWKSGKMSKSTSDKVAMKIAEYKKGYEGIDLEKLKFDDLEDACQPGWKALGTKQLRGRTVPNCIPESEHPDFQ